MAAKIKARPALAVYHGEQGIGGTGAAAALRKLKIPFAMITADEIQGGKLKNFKGIIFPGGGSIEIEKAGDREVKSFITKGGGCVGICAGCQYGTRMALLPVGWSPMRAGGIFDMRIIARHRISTGYEIAGKYPRGRQWKYSNKGRARIRYANGGIMLPGKGVRTIASFDEYGEHATIVTGHYGKGRVVLISPHPESTPAVKEKRYGDSDQSQDPLMLFANSISYILKQ
ncbi:hypothetical protein ACFL4W_02135 [Planctomycetota bacterium]